MARPGEMVAPPHLPSDQVPGRAASLSCVRCLIPTHVLETLDADSRRSLADSRCPTAAVRSAPIAAETPPARVGRPAQSHDEARPAPQVGGMAEKRPLGPPPAEPVAGR